MEYYDLPCLSIYARPTETLRCFPSFDRYVAPIRYPAYLVGRGLTRFVTGTISVAVTIGFGVLFLGVPLDLRAIDWPLFPAALPLGIVALVAMGIIVGLIVAATFSFRCCERLARERGMIDMVTNY